MNTKMLKKLLGLNSADISDEEIIAKVREAQKRNLDYIEFNVDGDITKVGIPHNISCPEVDSKGD